MHQIERLLTRYGILKKNTKGEKNVKFDYKQKQKFCMFSTRRCLVVIALEGFVSGMIGRGMKNFLDQLWNRAEIKRLSQDIVKNSAQLTEHYKCY